jgi:flagellar hook-associated protein 3 FlgL
VSEGTATTAEDLGLFAPGMFETAEEIRQALLNNDPERLSSLIANVDDAVSRVTSARAAAGQQITQMTFASSRLLDLQLSFESIRAKTEEADLAEFTTKLINQQTIYQATLATTAQVIQPTLFSFL